MSHLTVVVGVDRKSAEQIKVTAPTWKKVRPELWELPWLVFWCPSEDRGLTPSAMQSLSAILDVPNATYVRWDEPGFHTQREKMLTGHVYLPVDHVQTPWFVKIDTDAIACSSSPKWPLKEWFEPDDSGQYNCMIASSWGYSRAKGGGPLKDDLDMWCEVLESFGDRFFDTRRIGLANKISSRDHPRGPKVKMTRLASWICFQRTEWVASMADKFAAHCGRYRLPVPSHDTCLWYAAARSKERFTFAKQANYGWMVRNAMRTLENESRKVLEGVKQ